jgi:GH43 family beta-xylosidase
MKSAYRRTGAVLATVAGAVLVSGLVTTEASAAYPKGWSDSTPCSDVAVGSLVPITDSANHTTSPSPWVKASAHQLGYATGYQSFVVSFEQARVTSVGPCQNGAQVVGKVYDSGTMTTTNRVDWSHNGGVSPNVLNSRKDPISFSQLTCYNNWCAPTGMVQ